MVIGGGWSRHGVVAAALLFALGCDSNGGEGAATLEGDAVEAPAIAATHGGAIVDLEGAAAELVVHATGELHLHVVGDDEGDWSGAGATVTLDDAAGASHSVALRWEDGVQGFVGHLDATPARGEAEVILVRDGHRRRGAVNVTRLLPEGTHDGSVVSVGDHVVEVVVEPDGRAHLYVLEAPRQRLEVELTLSIAGEDGRLYPLALTWDAEAERYSGRLEGMTPHAGPMEVILERRGREALGRGTLLEVGLTAPALDGEGVPEDFRLEMPELGSELPAVIAVPPAEAERGVEAPSLEPPSAALPPAPSREREGE